MNSTLSKKQYVQPTSKGQVTLPIAVRRQLAIDLNTLFDVTIEHGRVILAPVKQLSTASQDQWETVIDFSDLQPEGIAIQDLQKRLTQWTKSKKPSAN